MDQLGRPGLGRHLCHSSYVSCLRDSSGEMTLQCPNKDGTGQLFVKQGLGLLQHTRLYACCVLQAVTVENGKKYHARTL